MPSLSPDGRTYTFTIGSGYRFSPPSNQPLTAETFRYSIERALSPKLETDAPGSMFVDDIEGEAAFRDGKADHISGLRANGDQLTVTLVKPSLDFLGRLSLPFFCPVPTGTPIVPGGAVVTIGTGDAGNGMVPSAGPYYIADAFNGEYTILRRNPNYRGPRPYALDAIALREGIDPGQAVQRVESGSWDGVVNLYDALLGPGGPLESQWGPDSDAAANGDQRWFGEPFPGIDALAFNAGRPAFSNPDVRRAAAVALDRSDLAAVFNESPTAALLPPAQSGQSGQAGPEPFTLDGPDVQEGLARSTAAVSLATRLAAEDLPATGFAIPENGQFFSDRLGCRTFPPFGYGVDLAALCVAG
jgi:ABC-type oligopeptide transport system substrate-binding subunit